MKSNNLDLPHLVRVCEELTDGSIPRPELTKEFYEFFNPTTVLALLRRLGEAEERVKELEGVIHPPSIAPTGGMFAGLPDHLQPQGIDPAYLRERKAP